ncbi:hypothetical protein Scep_006993 [Stephania cephalantha]|uniref:Uncharacterized protein n=1 Tax=Stephania cephalantha TaxID=152367 RepID=A0AAP0K905_9MAGN
MERMERQKRENGIGNGEVTLSERIGGLFLVSRRERMGTNVGYRLCSSRRVEAAILLGILRIVPISFRGSPTSLNPLSEHPLYAVAPPGYSCSIVVERPVKSVASFRMFSRAAAKVSR